MSKTEADSFDVIEEISDDVLPPSFSVVNQTPKPSTSGQNRSGKLSKKKQQQSTSSSSPSADQPSTSRGPSESGPSSNYLEVSSDTSSAAGFKLDEQNGISQSVSSTPVHQLPLTPEIEPINLTEDSLVLEATEVDSVVPDPPAISARLPPLEASEASNIDYLLSLLPPTELTELLVEDPIVIRGNGNMTLFGLSNSFVNTFPSSLLGRVSREEFEYTMSRINGLLRQQHSTNAKFLLLGCLCCCCSLGCSLLWPTFALSKRTRSSLEKVCSKSYFSVFKFIFLQLLAMENSRMYNKLGLNWRLSKQNCHNNHSFMEYVIFIDFIPKLQIYQPD